MKLLRQRNENIRRGFAPVFHAVGVSVDDPDNLHVAARG
jgi:hypothetical protein